MRQCNKVGCMNVHNSMNGYCADHQEYYQEQKAKRNKQYNEGRPARHQYYFTNTWRRLRDQYIKEHPLCCRCEQRGQVVLAELVDHIIEIEDNPDLKDSYSNLQSLCFRCHNVKTGETARERKKQKMIKGIGRDINKGWE